MAQAAVPNMHPLRPMRKSRHGNPVLPSFSGTCMHHDKHAPNQSHGQDAPTFAGPSTLEQSPLCRMSWPALPLWPTPAPSVYFAAHTPCHYGIDATQLPLCPFRAGTPHNLRLQILVLDAVCLGNCYCCSELLKGSSPQV